MSSMNISNTVLLVRFFKKQSDFKHVSVNSSLEPIILLIVLEMNGNVEWNKQNLPHAGVVELKG